MMQQQEQAVPKLRFPDFQDEWKETTIGNNFDFKNGLNKGKEFFGYGSPIVNFKDVFAEGGITKDRLKGLVEVTEQEKKNCSAHKGDVFFNRTSEIIEEIGRAAVLLEDIEDCVFSGFVLRARPTNDALIDDYKKYCFGVQSVRKEIVTKSSCTTRALTSGTLLSDVVYRYPEHKQEQKKIAAFLGAVDEKIAQLQKKKDLLEDYKKGCMQKLFSQELRFTDDNGNPFPDWEEHSLGSLMSLLSDYTANGSFAALKENVKYYNEENYAALVRATDLEKSTFVPERFTDKRGYDFLKKTSLSGDEIIFANVGNIGSVYRAPKYDKPMTLAPNTYLIKFNKKISEKFMFYMMSRNEFKNKVLSLVGGGGLKALNKSNLRSVEIFMPSEVNEQKKIADFLSALDGKIALVAKELDKAKAFKKGLLQQMFV